MPERAPTPDALTERLAEAREALFQLAGEVAQPVLYIFGAQDLPTYVRPKVRALQSNFLTGPFESIELEAGHWLIQEKPAEVVEAVLAHVRSLESEAATQRRKEAWISPPSGVRFEAISIGL